MHADLHANPRSVDEVLKLVGLEDVAARRVKQLSGGQQRRLDVGVALVGRPVLVLLDEPTTGFDPEARRRAWTMVASLRDLGTTVLLTTHYMEEAQVLADRVVVLQHGRIVGEGTPQELAEQLHLTSTVRFRLPGDVSVGDVPLSHATDVAVDGDMVSARSEHATALLAELCGWAAARDTELEGLQVLAPTLEDSYLALTASDAATVVPS
jgi:ABC-2 type transport system ATP-binding protein